MKHSILVALALCATAAHADNQCALTRIEICRDTNQLVWDRAFQAAVGAFVGTRRADYLYSGNHLVSEQILDVLGGPPDPVRRSGELWWFTACRSHSCDEKGAAVIGAAGEIDALAILHTPCALPKSARDCYAHDTLTIFVRSPQWVPRVRDGLVSWAKDAIAGGYYPASMPRTTLDRVEVFPG